ncbi:MAG: Crp/Fnr family transcriptional regulator [Solirubrobacterales bacterium]|nr:Crp/Fnr family transcriptional regulator [Solirubrobacterales bacterium]MBV9800822.1 Crp/Fnr family transcriptional regulator [Solirubrobacterales bacterium]
MSVRPAPSGLCHVLREDPELAEPIDAARREQATHECTAREMWISPGNLAAQGSLMPAGGIGLLVLEGLLIRRVGIDQRSGAEVLGEGDVLRPWLDERESSTLNLTTGWSVIEPARFAVLDEDFVQNLGRYPELAVSLIARALQRSRTLAVNMAIVHQARVDVRLHMLLWHLAGRWGRVRSDGTVLPVRLTHSVLADLVAARRPTVTSALSDLSRRGLVRWEDDAWLLSGEPPGELLDLAPGASAGARHTG